MGRLSYCQNYSGTNLDIKNLKPLELLNLTTIRGNKKEYLVLDVNVEENIAIIIENTLYDLNNPIIEDKHLRYLADETEMKYSYDGLIKDGRKLCKNWKNSRLLSCKK